MNIVRTAAGKSSNRLKFCWLKVILNVKLRTELGDKQRAIQKSRGI